MSRALRRWGGSGSQGGGRKDGDDEEDVVDSHAAVDHAHAAVAAADPQQSLTR